MPSTGLILRGLAVVTACAQAATEARIIVVKSERNEFALRLRPMICDCRWFDLAHDAGWMLGQHAESEAIAVLVVVATLMR